MDEKVLLTTLGRSHLITAASNLIKQGVDLHLLQGWVPKNLDSISVRLAAKIVGRKSLIAGFAKRQTPELEGRIVSEPIPEFVQTILLIFFQWFGQKWYHVIVSVSFWLHGFFTRRHLKGFNIYHVKSGLGRGGAIRKAHKLGMKVLVDHCVPHPLAMKKSTGDSGYDEWWSYWNLVMADCAEGDLIMVGSQYVKDTFVKFGYSPDKIRVVKLAVLPHFSYAKTCYAKEGVLELIYTGMWQHHKGVDDLVDAIEILVRQGVNIQLNVFGAYSDSNPAYQKARRLALPITFHGHVPQEDLREHLARADVYVFPSLRDGFAVSAFEGMAAGLCLVTTYESSIPLIEGKTGFYVPTHDPTAIANRIINLYNNREIIEYVGRYAADVVAKEFTWENYAKNVRQVYVELLSR